MEDKQLPEASEPEKRYEPSDWSAPHPPERHDDSRPPRPPLGPEHPKVRFLALATILIVSVTCGFLGGWLAKDINKTAQTQQVVLKTQGQVIANIADSVGASVVSVNTVSNVVTQDPLFGFDRPGVQEGAGTGVILTDDGLVVTNRHVVPLGTTKVSITLSDGTEFDNVTVVGRTNSRDSLDVAFLKINDLKGQKLVPAKLGDSSKMQVGEAVVAIGNALGQFQNTVTSGILSGYGRSVQASDSSGASTENLEDLFQTDAAINQGNSGGPLVNLEGEVIGLNTALAGGAQNIGFAIPINDIKGLIDSVKHTGKLQRPYLGVIYVPLTNDLAELYHLDTKRGAYIAPKDISGSEPVIANGPADKAGVQAGDIITKIDDKTIDQSSSLSALVNQHQVGDKVKLTVVRDGKEQTITVTLGLAPTE